MSSTDRPLVSVIMPAHNLEDVITPSVASVLAQTVTDIELLVIDDASTDETADVVTALAEKDARVRLIRSERNLGGAGARNLGLRSARASRVAFLDGDDMWHERKLEHQLEVMRATGAELVYTAMQKIDMSGKMFGKVQQVPESVGYDELLGNPLIGCSTVLLNYAAVGRPLMPDIRKRQDFAFWLMLLRKGARAVGINEPLTFYRVRPGSLSSNKVSAAWYVWRVYRELERLPLVKAVPSFVSYALRAYLKRLNR